MNRKPGIVVAFLFCFYALQSFSSETDEYARVAQSPAWHRLMHYRHAFWGGVKSDVDGPGYFFAQSGKTDPLAELRASVEAFTRPDSKDLKIGKLKQSPQCAFPERYRFLKKELGLKTPDLKCPFFEQFLERFHDPQSVSLIFSNAYQDNPASMFGHTFLRINANTKTSSKKMDLLDQGVSYAANVGPNENPLVFYYLGVTGGYPGAFTVVPYYVKVNEYSHAESRDLWEYNLDLNPAQTLTLIRHLWELETNTWFDYWFFDENCAYELLALLEVARPDWDLTDKTPPWVIPGETAKIMAKTPGAVTSVSFRPSYRRKLLQRFESLSPDEQVDFFKLRAGAIAPSDVNDSKTIDAVTAYLTYKKQKDEGRLPAAEKQILTQALIRRSELGEISSTSEPEVESGAWITRPDLGHGAGRVSATSGLAGLASRPQDHSGLFFQEFHWRSAYHDLLNDDVGYLRFSQIEFPNIHFRYYPALSRVRVERIGALSVMSLFPLTSVEIKPSWGMDLAYQSPKDYGCLDCHTLRGRGYIGLSSTPFSPGFLFYTLAVANLELGESLHKGWRVGPGIQATMLANPFPHAKTQLRYELISDLFQQDRMGHFYEAAIEQSLSLSPSFELRGGYSFQHGQGGYDEARLSFQYYF